ncbi:MAG: FG-GAP repeat protein [Ignavibacteriae bacterium]|nr:FG-GAP repeat protein [Ignavibacteriota bacterium]
MTSFISSLSILFVFYIYFFSNIYGQTQFSLGFTEDNLAGDSQFGYSVNTAGDVNNDGFDDVIIGAFINNQASIFFGSASMNNKPDIILKEDGYSFGKSVSSAGDINNDGYDDIIVGDPLANKVYVYLGGDNMDDIVDYIINGYNYDEYSFGKVVATVGDINNDGYDDIIIGSDNDFYIGAAYLFLGSKDFDLNCDLILKGEDRENYFGSSISFAGDINNDGYADFIIGAYGYNSTNGKCYIYLGNKEINDIIKIELIPSPDIGLFGRSVSGACDVNGDGYDDIIIGLKSSTKGNVYIYYGGESLNDAPNIILSNDIEYDEFGFSISSIDDINNDGYDDICIGDPSYLSSQGRAYIYLGGEPFSSSPSIILSGESNVDFFGNCVSKAGDVNSDGYADFIIGIHGFYNYKGKANIYLGSTSINDISTISMQGSGIQNVFGYSVSSLGDVNKDGFDDIIISARGYDSNKGSAYIYFGGTDVDNYADVICFGENSQDYFGTIISKIGDINNDGYNDVFIGAPSFESDKGKGYLYFGGSFMDNIPDIVFIGNKFYDHFCSSASGIGDINGDGYDDLAIGSNKNGNGSVNIYLGSNNIYHVADLILQKDGSSNFGHSIASAGDINNDGYDDFLISYQNAVPNNNAVSIYFGNKNLLDISNSFIVIEKTDVNFGQSVSAAGDVNSDGYADIIIGAGSATSIGSSYIYFGGNAMDSEPDIKLSDGNFYDAFGYSVSTVGDINKDGYDDVIVSAHGYDAYTGSAYIYFGGSSMDIIPDIFLIGENRDDLFGSVVSNAGDINGDGYMDILTSSKEYNNNGKAYTYFGQELSKIQAPKLNFPTNNSEKISKKVDLVWQKSIDIDFYQIQISLDSDFVQLVLKENIFFPDTIYNFNNLNKLTKYFWRVRQCKKNVFGSWSKIWNFTTLEGSIPEKLVMSQNYPNPFNNQTNFEYGIPDFYEIKFEIFNILGQKVTTISIGENNPGYHVFNWKPINLSSGIYIVRIYASDKNQKKEFVTSVKAILLK